MIGRSYFHAAMALCLLGTQVALAAGSGFKNEPAPSADKVEPLKVNEGIPLTKVTAENGKLVKMNVVVAQKPTVMVFYRGHWCPFCMKHLAALQEIAGQLEGMGVQLIAITPDKPAYVAEAKKKANLTFPIYSDSGLEFARAMGVAFTLDPQTAARYKEHLVESTGHDTGELPVPAVFFTNKQGRIQHVYWNADYKVRISNEDLLKEAKKLQD